MSVNSFFLFLTRNFISSKGKPTVHLKKNSYHLFFEILVNTFVL